MQVAEPPKQVMIVQYDGGRRKEVVVWSRRNMIKQITYLGNKVFIIHKVKE